MNINEYKHKGELVLVCGKKEKQLGRYGRLKKYETKKTKKNRGEGDQEEQNERLIKDGLTDYLIKDFKRE